jgi:F-type H+-transporting ATPase subunit delta
MKKKTNLQFAKALYEVTKGLPEKNLPEAIKQFFLVLQKNNKIKKIEYIIDEFIRYSKKQSGIKTIKIESVQKVNENVVEKIKKLFGQTAEVSNIINKELLGGMKITVDDTAYDASVKTQLQRLKQSLIS